MAFDSAASFLAGFEPADAGCVLLDVRMPGVDGLTLLERLAALPAGLSGRIPRIHFRTDVAGTPAFLMEELPGITLDAPAPQLEAATREAAAFVTRLHVATRRMREFGPATLLARTMSPRLPLFFSQLPIWRSVLPCVCALAITGYISAVSMKLMPRSSA